MLSGTSALLRNIFRCNSHTCGDAVRTASVFRFRHKNCNCSCCVDATVAENRLERLVRSAQRAAVRQAGYISGYCSKVQKVSAFHLQMAANGMRGLQETIADRPSLRHLIAVSNRLLNDLEVKGISSTIT